jgi:pyruvate formate lyase activating enzyme
MPTFNVFDIKRFAVHDGDGLRTTVFFKGCPLRCKWCQNPEGLEAKPQPVYLKAQCIQCGLCMKAAKKDQLSWNNGPVINRINPGNFDEIVKACPSGALRYDSTAYTKEQLMENILSDKVFYRDRGGVTFSGGEPFVQGESLIELLKACKEAGIHTAIESSFFADQDLVQNAAPHLDRIFADVKILDRKKHKAATGQDNQIILDNVAWLLTSEHKDKVIIRTPLIPGWSADEENIASIARFISGLYADVKYELLNYNPLASSKYEMTGKEYPLGSLAMFDKKTMEHFQSIAKTNGIKNLITE